MELEYKAYGAVPVPTQPLGIQLSYVGAVHYYLTAVALIQGPLYVQECGLAAAAFSGDYHPFSLGQGEVQPLDYLKLFIAVLIAFIQIFDFQNIHHSHLKTVAGFFTSSFLTAIYAETNAAKNAKKNANITSLNITWTGTSCM